MGEPPKTFPNICSAWLHRSGSFPTQTGLPEDLELGPPEQSLQEPRKPALRPAATWAGTLCPQGIPTELPKPGFGR